MLGHVGKFLVFLGVLGGGTLLVKHASAGPAAPTPGGGGGKTPVQPGPVTPVVPSSPAAPVAPTLPPATVAILAAGTPTSAAAAAAAGSTNYETPEGIDVQIGGASDGGGSDQTNLTGTSTGDIGDTTTPDDGSSDSTSL